ncbi:uncharacterized protein LOC143235595 [Tachypleus tridentatus]|uniref:uncharacterized protein LOC143235595 n=1 Tax=Tachypleus tridentatus TaxID=6853 RepID=UPI003FD5C5D4
MDGDKIVEDLFCKTITAGIKAQDWFEILDIFVCENNLDWTKCIDVYTDGGRSISGCYGDLQTLTQSKALDVLWTQCIIHRRALASKHLRPPLNLVLKKDMEKFACIQDPFKIKVLSEFTSADEENLIELSCDKNVKTTLGSMELTAFCTSVKDEYPPLSAKAKRILIPFATSYLCEADFVAVAVIKSKYSAKINVEHKMKVAVTNLIPRFQELCSLSPTGVHIPFVIVVI